VEMITKVWQDAEKAELVGLLGGFCSGVTVDCWEIGRSVRVYAMSHG
jgi:hypothetical protein